MNKFRYVKRVKVLSEFPSRKKKGPTLFREKFKFRFVSSTKSYFILTLMAVKSAIRHARCKMQKKNFVFFFSLRNGWKRESNKKHSKNQIRWFSSRNSFAYKKQVFVEIQRWAKISSLEMIETIKTTQNEYRKKSRIHLIG